MPEQVLVLGAGPTGLAAAYALAKAGQKVLLIEKTDKLGGLVRGIKLGNSFIECGYHIIFPGQNNTLGMFKDLGLGDKIIWRTARTGFFADRLYKVSAPWEVLNYKPLPLLDRIKIVTTTLKMMKTKDALALDSMTCKEWVEKEGSKKLYEKFYGPMMRGKFSEFADEISATWLVERMKLRNKRNLGGEIIGYPLGGFQQMINRLEEELLKMGVEIKTNTVASKLEIKDNRVVSAHIGTKKIPVKAVVSTVPPPVLSQIVGLPKEYLDNFLLPYEGVICVLLALKKPITKNLYWTNIMRDDTAFKAIVEHSNLAGNEQFGSYPLYLASYPPYTSEFWKMSDQEIVDVYFSDLQRLFPDEFSKNDIVWCNVFREKYTAIVCKKGLATKIKNLSCKTPIGNLFVGGMFNSYPEGNIDLAIEKGKECAELAMQT